MFTLCEDTCRKPEISKLKKCLKLLEGKINGTNITMFTVRDFCEITLVHSAMQGANSFENFV